MPGLVLAECGICVARQQEYGLVWLGAAVIFGSTLYIAHREHVAHRRARDKA